MNRSRTLTIAVIAMSLTGCSDAVTPPSDAPTEFVAPAWMAEQVQAEDELAAAQAACMTEKGFTFTQDKQGGFIVPDEVADEFPPALRECTRVYLGDDMINQQPTDEQYRALYKRQLDTRDCLINEGYTIEEPISEEKYIDSRGNWSAYIDLNTGLSDDAFAALKRTCPEPGLLGL